MIEVHSLKSTSLNVGAARLSELARALEAAGRNGELDSSASSKNAELLALYRQVLDAGRAYLGESTPAPEEPAGADELTELSAAALGEYLTRAKDACRSFDPDAREALSRETAA